MGGLEIRRGTSRRSAKRLERHYDGQVCVAGKDQIRVPHGRLLEEKLGNRRRNLKAFVEGCGEFSECMHYCIG